MRIIAGEKRIAMNFSGFYVLAKLFCKHGFFKSLLIIAAAFVLIVAFLGSEPGFLLFLGTILAVEFVVLFIYYAVKSSRDKEKRMEEYRKREREKYPDATEDTIEFFAQMDFKYHLD